MQYTPVGSLLPKIQERQLLPIPSSPRPNAAVPVTLAWQLRWGQGSPTKTKLRLDKFVFNDNIHSLKCYDNH